MVFFVMIFAIRSRSSALVRDFRFAGRSVTTRYKSDLIGRLEGRIVIAYKNHNTSVLISKKERSRKEEIADRLYSSKLLMLSS
jgi:hypothetical protein